MENEMGNVETDSVADLVLNVPELVDPTDHIADLCTHALDNAGDLILAGSADAVTVGPQTEADARQAIAPDTGYITEGFEPFGDPTVIQPSVALEALANRHGAEQSAMDPVGVTHFGPHSLASGAMFMDQSGKWGSELGGYVDPCLARQSFERAAMSNWGGPSPTTTGAQMSTTTTLTSTSVASSALGGPAHALYARCPPHAGLTPVHPARQAFVSQSVELPGSFPRAWPGLGTRRPEFGNFETIWGIRPLAVVSDPSLQVTSC